MLSALLLGKPMRLTDLAKAEAVSLPTMNQTINRMILSGWVARMPQPDSSTVLIEITDEGRRVAESAAQLRSKTILKRLKQLSAGELAALQQFIATIDKMYPREPWVFDPTDAA